MMCNCLLELHRVLKPTGSLYLHCDPTASHYLKIVLDGCLEGKHSRVRSFGNEPTLTDLRSAMDHCTTLSFSLKGDAFTLERSNRPARPCIYRKSLSIRRKTEGTFKRLAHWRASELATPVKPWRGIDPTSVNRHWALPNDLLHK